MNIIQILAEYILIFYGLLGVASIWLVYEIRRILKQHWSSMLSEEWATPSPEQAWKPKPPEPAPAKNPLRQIKATADTDPLKQFFQKEHVTEPLIKAIKSRKE